MKNDIEYIITRGAACDIESIVQFQADMAMESEGCVLDKEKVTKGVTSAMLDDSKGFQLSGSRRIRTFGACNGSAP